MSSQVFTHFSILKTAIDEIFAFHGAMKGQPPKNIDSGKGITALQQSDIEHLGPIVDGFEEADQRVLYQALTLMAANYERGRMDHVGRSKQPGWIFVGARQRWRFVRAGIPRERRSGCQRCP